MELRFRPEVEDQRNLEIRRPEVVECLAFRCRRKRVRRLDFDDNPLSTIMSTRCDVSAAPL